MNPDPTELPEMDCFAPSLPICQYQVSKLRIDRLSRGQLYGIISSLCDVTRGV